MRSIVKILEEKIQQKERERKAQEERELEFQQKAVELVKEALKERGYDPKDIVFTPRCFIFHGDMVDVEVRLSPVGYRLSPARTYEPTITCRFEGDKAGLHYVTEAIEDLVNPFYWCKEPEFEPEFQPEPPKPEPLADEIAEIKAALRRIFDWAGI